MVHYEQSFPSPDSVQELQDGKIAQELTVMLINSLNSEVTGEVRASIQKRLLGVLSRIASRETREAS